MMLQSDMDAVARWLAEKSLMLQEMHNSGHES